MVNILTESCSCKMICPCAMGPAEPDQAWCSAIQIVEIREGRLDDVDLGGVRYGFAAQLPGDFFSGIDKARLYFDEAKTPPPQRGAIEAIYQGRAGGFWEGLQEMFADWLSSKVAGIQLSVTDAGVQGSIDVAGELQLTYVRTEDGKQATLMNPPVSAALASRRSISRRRADPAAPTRTSARGTAWALALTRLSPGGADMVTGQAALSRPPRARVTPQIVICLLVAPGAAAWTVVRADGMWTMAGTMGLDLPAFVGMWTLKMAAMMLPSVAPFASLYSRTVREQRLVRLTDRSEYLQSAVP